MAGSETDRTGASEATGNSTGASEATGNRTGASEATGRDTDWRTESRFYRGKPGAGWVVALVAVPALLALIGWGGTDRSAESDELILPTVNPTATLGASAAAPSPTAAETTTAPAAGFPAWSIIRSGNEFRIAGGLPDEQTKQGLLDTLNLVLPAAAIVDELRVVPGVRTPDVAGLGGIFSSAVGIPDFALTLNGDTVTLTGGAPAEPIKASAETYTRTAFPNLNVINNIEVTGPSPLPAGPSPASPRPPVPPSPTASSAPPGECATLQADIDALLKTPITFGTGGTALTPESARVVADIADMAAACPDAKLSVVGYTDDTGSDAVNLPLSGSRAEAVADALVSGGVPAASVTSRGAGAADPVAGNGTAEGRAQNRRVEITVS